ncbi:MAG TPA: protein kinase [Vicinamibacterales bacterium]|nr:protein kinase [Vicinamibacterales bacterium]
MPLPTGTHVGAYLVLGSLGTGGMGEVYRAHDAKLGREVALKILPEPFASDPQRLARFELEARALASLNHPHIAHIYGVEESGTTRALVLELVEGENLAERIARGSIGIDEALAIAQQIADALDAAHEKGVIHRDLKPANIKLRPDGVVKILDFGLAKVFTHEGTIADESSTRTATVTRAGTILGTAAYMSPEQARGLRVDKRTDIWSFGCVLYEMLTGRRAFAGDTFVFSTRPEHQPSYSPDGQKVVFVSDSTGASEIWICDKDGANLVQLTSTAWPETAAPRWSPDGSQIVFHSRPDGPGDIFTVPSGGGAPKRITDDPADDWGASWSPDGQWIYFASNRTGRFEIWRTPASGGLAVQVTTTGGIGPTLSADGRYAYYAKGTELWRIAVNGGDDSRVLESLSDWSRFALTEEGIYFIPARRPPVRTSSDYTIDFFRMSNGRIRTVAQTDKLPFLGLTVSPDGRSLLYSQIDQSGTDLMLVENIR